MEFDFSWVRQAGQAKLLCETGRVRRYSAGAYTGGRGFKAEVHRIIGKCPAKPIETPASSGNATISLGVAPRPRRTLPAERKPRRY